MSDAPMFSLSELGISSRFENDADLTQADIDSDFTAQVQEALKHSSIFPDPASGPGDSGDPSPATGDEEEEEDTGTLSAGTDEATDDSDADDDTISEDSADDGAEGGHSSPPSSLSIPLNDGQTFQLTEDHARSLLALASWAQSIPEQTRYAFAAIESGQAVAVPKSDYAAFLQWQQARPTPTSLADELDELGIDPSLRDRIRALESQVASIPDPIALREQQEAQARYDHVNAIIPQTLTAYQSSRNITESQMNERLSTALNLQLIARLTEQETLRAPDGRVIREPDHAAIITRAMDMVAGGGFVAPLPTPVIQQPPVASPPPAASPTPAAPPANVSPVAQKVAVKKARASSLSTAPSAATSAPRSTEPMSTADMTAVIAKALQDAARNGN